MFLAFIFAAAITSKSSADNPVTWSEPNADSTVIRVDQRTWTIAELNQVAMEALRHNGAQPQTNHSQTIVHIMPKDGNTMCEFTFSQGFDRPYWRVTVGYDGHVKKCEKRLRKEG